TKIGKTGEAIQIVSRSHRNYVRGIVTRGIKRKDICILTAVSCRRYKKKSRVIGCVDGIEQRLRETATTPTVGEDANVDASVLHHYRIVDALYSICERAETGSREELEPHQLHIPVDSYHSYAVISPGAYSTGDMRAVTVIVERVTAPRYC